MTIPADGRLHPDGKTHKHAYLACPVCGYRVDAASPMTGQGGPKDGDAGLCLACASVNIYVIAAGATALRLPTPEERTDLARDPDVQTAVQRLISVRDRSRRAGRSWPKGPGPA